LIETAVKKDLVQKGREAQCSLVLVMINF